MPFIIKASDAWAESGSMSAAKGEAGCAQSASHGLVIAGGVNGVDLTGLATVANTVDGETVDEELPPMPVGKTEHCLVALDGGDLFVTGGLSPEPPEKTFLFRSASRAWTEVAPMPTARYTLMCGLIRSPAGKQEVVAAGGFYFQYYDTVEIYSIDSNLWRTGKFV